VSTESEPFEGDPAFQPMSPGFPAGVELSINLFPVIGNSFHCAST
jgi:hypothetical protein